MKENQFKKVYWIEWAVLAGCILAIFCASFVGFAAECDAISDKVLRLHILANSDQEEDQQLKLAVRDRVLQETGGFFESETDLEAAKRDVSGQLERIHTIAQEEVIARGYSYPVEVELVDKMYFNTRRYGELTLPAGKYDALRITIGAAQGHNWWCVLYPPLCLPAAEADERDLEKQFTEDEIELVESDPNYDVRFALIEMFEKIKSSFFK